MIPPADEEALSSALLKFAETKTLFDAAKIRAYAVEHYSYEVVGQELTDIYTQAMQHSRD
ncbi:MAG: hypothetical protein EBU33_03200 [Sphingobacteriia bacterium]|nr:hypothetical protein [Sphingobacteriia bacterium]